MVAKDKSDQDAQNASADILSKRFAGQTIRTATLKMQKNGGTLQFDLVGTKTPAKIEWRENGKVIFTFKDRPYLIRK